MDDTTLRLQLVARRRGISFEELKKNEEKSRFDLFELVADDSDKPDVLRRIWDTQNPTAIARKVAGTIRSIDLMLTRPWAFHVQRPSTERPMLLCVSETVSRLVTELLDMFEWPGCLPTEVNSVHGDLPLPEEKDAYVWWYSGSTRLLGYNLNKHVALLKSVDQGLLNAQAVRKFHKFLSLDELICMPLGTSYQLEDVPDKAYFRARYQGQGMITVWGDRPDKIWGPLPPYLLKSQGLLFKPTGPQVSFQEEHHTLLRWSDMYSLQDFRFYF